jgi:hypothetical protein
MWQNQQNGAAYVFHFNGGNWTQQAKLLPAGMPQQFFGWSTAIQGDDAIVGAYLAGAVYVFSRIGANWSQQARLTAATTQNSLFGTSVAFDGDLLLIGSFFEGNQQLGSYSVFRKVQSSWLQTSQFRPNSSLNGDGIGIALAISGASMLIGASGTDGLNIDSGAVYFYTLRDIFGNGFE